MRFQTLLIDLVLVRLCPQGKSMIFTCLASLLFDCSRPLCLLKYFIFFYFQETGSQGSQAAICVYIRQLRLKHWVSVFVGTIILFEVAWPLERCGRLACLMKIVHTKIGSIRLLKQVRIEATVK